MILVLFGTNIIYWFYLIFICVKLYIIYFNKYFIQYIKLIIFSSGGIKNNTEQNKSENTFLDFMDKLLKKFKKKIKIYMLLFWII